MYAPFAAFEKAGVTFLFCLGSYRWLISPIADFAKPFGPVMSMTPTFFPGHFYVSGIISINDSSAGIQVKLAFIMTYLLRKECITCYNLKEKRRAVNSMGNVEQGEWSVLEYSSPPRIYDKGEMIYWQGSHAEEFYYLKSGSVRVFLCSENGAEKTLSVMKSGRIFGEAAFFDGLPRVSSARAQQRSEAIPVTRRSLMECISKEPQLAVDLLAYLSQTIRMLSAQLDTVAFQQADERVARLLLSLSAENGLVCATHEDLAALAGVSRVTVSRVLADFSRRGWVRTHYRKIRVADTAALRQFLPLDNDAVKKGAL